ncbi:MAG: UDP-N-acetylmuramoyl-L-alanine--D-glutamate ligase [Balneolales bacterium]
MISVKAKHIVIIGAAKSGVAAAMMLQDKGASVFVTDSGEIKPSMRSLLKNGQIDYEENGHSQRAESGEYAVVSPGVPTETALVQKYITSGKKVYSEIEAASWFCQSPILAITGSNGKTTAANWMAHVRQTAGRPYLLAGNIGVAFSDVVAHTASDKDLVLEVSSFQLDHIDTFRPQQSLLLNITPDHLNRYNHTFSNYANSKLRISENQKAGDTVIYWADDPLLSSHFSQPQKDGPEGYSFSDTREVDRGAFVRDEYIFLKISEEAVRLMPVAEVSLPGRHNLYNGMATALSARLSGIDHHVIRESLGHFAGVEHRLEFVREKEGIRYYNDSKATNINSVWYALESFNVPIVLILGGRDKGNDYTSLAGLIREKVHTVIAIGEARQKIRDQIQNVVPRFFACSGMEEAVSKASVSAKKGDVVLLSPACASFDMFENYEDRGSTFKSLVNTL